MTGKNRRITYKGKIIGVVEEDVEIGGKTVVFEKAVRSPGIRLIIEKNNKLLLSKEFRHELKQYDYRLAGGKVVNSFEEYIEKSDSNLLELAVKAAKNEAKEELGIAIKEIELFYVSKLGATMEWDLYYFIVQEFEELGSQTLEEGEDIKPVWIKKEKVKKMCLNSEISEERSAMAILKYLLRRI